MMLDRDLDDKAVDETVDKTVSKPGSPKGLQGLVRWVARCQRGAIFSFVPCSATEDTGSF